MALKYQCKTCKEIIPYRDSEGNKTCGPERICPDCKPKDVDPVEKPKETSK